MKIFELGINEVPADQQGLSPTPTTSVTTTQKPIRPGQGIASDAADNRQAMDQNKPAMGAEENPVIANKQKQEQKKTVQNQIKATQVQLKQLQAQLAAIR